MNATPILRSRQEQLIEHRFAEPMDVLLRRLYVDEGLTQAEIAHRLDASVKTVLRWMAKYGIPTRDRRALAQVASAEAVA
jgi:DNA-binding transcriptional regulator YiaG